MADTLVCATCDSVHGSNSTVAVGRFDPAGVSGYRSRLGGPLRPTRAVADADYCAALTQQKASSPAE